MSKTFSPVAIVSQSCILPGCQSPDELWEIIKHGRSVIQEVPENYWKIDPKKILSNQPDGDHTHCSQQGYVRDFKLDPSLLAEHYDYLSQLDPLFQWSVTSAIQAYRPVKGVSAKTRERTSVVLGNLSYPSSTHANMYEEQALHKLLPDLFPQPSAHHPDNRFGSSLPAKLISKVLDLGGEAFCLDAACASSLYAIKIACDQLQSGEADLVLAGGINAADSLFLHIGFSALSALSPSGQSRPFHKNADGLIPAEGAAFFALKRLDDALNDNDDILGLVRGIGLSNDGREGGFLSPSTHGQIKSMRQAYATSGIDPDDISYIECHATGTATGDSREIESMARVFGDTAAVPVGSLKGSLGHLITASGAASIIKVLQGFKYKQLPYMAECTEPNASLKQTGFNLPAKDSPWPSTAGPRKAAVNGFGFGGNNAHVILEEWVPEDYPEQLNYGNFADTDQQAPSINNEVSLIAVEMIYGQLESSQELLQFLESPEENTTAADQPRGLFSVALDAKTMGFPPRDLEASLGQQTLLLKLLERNAAIIEQLNPAKTAVFVGMEVDSESNRTGLRLHLEDHLSRVGVPLTPEQLKRFKDDIYPALNAARVIGCMPNIPANRVNNKYNFEAQGFTISAADRSNRISLNYAIKAIQQGEIESAIVGAVDLTNSILSAPDHSGQTTVDAAMVWILCDSSIAQRLALPSLARFTGLDGNPSSETQNVCSSHQVLKKFYQRYGTNVLVQELLEMSLPVFYGLQGRPPFDNVQYNPLSSDGGHRFKISDDIVMTVNPERLSLLTSRRQQPGLALFCGKDIEELRKNVSQDIFCEDTDKNQFARTGFVYHNESSYEALKTRCLENLSRADSVKGYANGICFYPQKLQGETACMFTGAASAYVDAAHELLENYPLLTQKMQREFSGNLNRYCGWMYPQWGSPLVDNSAFNDLCGSSFVCQLHAQVSQQIWQLQPSAVFGLSSGETNSMFAFGLWKDLPDLFEAIWESGLYQRELAGTYDTVKRYWGMDSHTGIDWQTWVVYCDAAKITKLVERHDKVYLTIISSDSECVIAGEASACKNLLAQLADIPYTRVNHDLACHSPVLGDFEPTWRRMHTRTVTVTNQSSPRFYSNYFGGQYQPKKQTVAEALTGQAGTGLDFPRIIRQVYADGVRIFIEHGPRDSLCRFIKSTLSTEQQANCLLLCMDDFAKDSVALLYQNTLQLWCAGQKINLHDFNTASKTSRPVCELKLRQEGPFIRLREMEQPHSEPSESPPPELNLEANETSFEMPRAPQLKAPDFSNDFEPPVIANQPVSYVAEMPITESLLNSVNEPAHYNTGNGNIQSLIESIFAQQTDLHIGYLEHQRKSYEVFTHNLQLHMQSALQHLSGMNGMELAQSTVAASAVIQMVVMPESKEIFETSVAQPVMDRQTPVIEPESTPAETTEPDNAIVEPPVSSPQTDYDYHPTGRTFSRQDLEVLSAARISSRFGPEFKGQDKYAIQVRMPEPPLLLCDRVTGIDAVAKSMQTGTIWTETDVREDSWYTHHGYMPAGIFIEAGQADLLLISYLGIDFHNRGERAYRLLGCELQFFGNLPKAGDTLQYKICVDGHAQSGDIRLFFFHYDCYINGKKRISVRNGQAGFFSKQELNDSSGVLWNPQQADYANTPIAEAPVTLKKNRFSSEEVQRYLKGDLVGCFGEDFFWTRTHTRTPTSSSGRLNFIQEIAELSQNGGPAGRGYLRAVSKISPDDWYFTGHFKNDPCMPGTLMAEGCLQMMSFYMIALGYTLHRDGWRFQPVAQTNYKFDCRGQVIPESDQLIYEIFVDEIITDPVPTLYAHVLCTVDGCKAFLCERLGLQLVPDWPLTGAPISIHDKHSDKCVSFQGFRFDNISLLNCALGQPSNAFGERYRVYDSGTRSSRLPGPPYHFMSRITQLDAEFGNPYNQPSVVAEYDVTKEAWFFRENGTNTMPYCVLMEIALQPCGWLSSFCRDHEIHGEELLYRNLDGLDAVQHRELPQDDYILRTEVNMTSASRAGTLIINQFDVKTYANDELVYSYQTAFGFFPPQSMLEQKGLKITANDQALLNLPTNIEISLNDYPDNYFNYVGPSLPASKLLMLDRIVHFSADGGEYRRGYIRGEKDVKPEDWFFKAHFFQDSVQPGSLGVEAALQLMQAYILTRDPALILSGRQFEPVVIGEDIEWHYRGQIAPDKILISVDMEVIEEIQDDKGRLVWARAKVWIDGLKIYELPKVGMRLKAQPQAGRQYYVPWELDSLHAPWVLDHCPTYSVPALPFTYLLELACQASGADLESHGIYCPHIEVRSWMNLTRNPASRELQPPLAIQGEIKVSHKTGQAFQFEVYKKNFAQKHPPLEAPQNLCGVGTIEFVKTSSNMEFPALPDLVNAQDADLPYKNGDFFHGPAFQLLNRYQLGNNGASATTTAGLQGVPHGRSGFALFDAAIQAIPHQQPRHWCKTLAKDLISYPFQIRDLKCRGKLPEKGTLEIETRYLALRENRFMDVDIWILKQEQVIASFRLVLVLVPKGITQSMTAKERYQFIVEHKKLSSHKVISTVGDNEGAYSLSLATVRNSDWLAGTLEYIYDLSENLSLRDKTRHILLKEYLGQIQDCHPANVAVNVHLLSNHDYLEQNYHIRLTETDEGFELYPCAAVLQTHHIDLPARLTKLGFGPSLLTDLITGFCRRFIGETKFADFKQIQDMGACIFLANHQVAIESLLFGVVNFAITGRPLATISKAENKDHWLGQFHEFGQQKYRDANPLEILYFQRENPTELLNILSKVLAEMADTGKSLFVHAGGTREQYEGQGIEQMSSFIIDQAVQFNKPVVPVLFSNALPPDDQHKKYELPVHLNGQSYCFGKAIMPAEFRDLNSNQRVELFLQRLSRLNTEPRYVETDLDFQHKANLLCESHGISLFAATCILVLKEKDKLSEESRTFLSLFDNEGVTDLLQQMLPIFKTDA